MHIETTELTALAERPYPLTTYVHRYEPDGTYGLFVTNTNSSLTVHAYFEAEHTVQNGLSEEQITHSDALLTSGNAQTELVAYVKMRDGSQYTYVFNKNPKEQMETLMLDTAHGRTVTYILSHGGHPFTYEAPMREMLNKHLDAVKTQVQNLLPVDLNPLLSPILSLDQIPRTQSPTGGVIWELSAIE